MSERPFAELAAKLRVLRGKNVRLMRSTLYYNVEKILAALDISARSEQSIKAEYTRKQGILSSHSEIKS